MEEVDLRALVKLIGRYRGLIGGLVFLCVVASASYTLLAVKREYEARTTLLYADRGSVSSAASGLAGSLGIPLGMSAAGPASWYETILTSRRLARLLVRKHDLVRVLEAKNEGDAIGKLLDRIIVNGKPEANAVMVTVRMPGTPKLYPGRPLDLDRARLAAALANDLVGQLDTWLQTTDYQASSKQRRFVEQQLTRVLGQVNTTREQLLATFRRTGVFAPDDQGQAWLQAMAQLEKDLAAAQTQLAGTEIAQQAGMSSDEVRRLASAAQAAQNAGAVANDVRKQLSELEVQLRREVEVNRKTEDHPDVAQLRGSIKELKGKLNTELAIVNSARTLQEQQLTSQLSMGQARFGELRGRLSALPAHGLDVQQLKRKLESQTNLADLLTKQLMMARISEAQQSQAFNILDAAEAPGRAASPSLSKAVAIGLVVGLLLALMLVGALHFRGQLAQPTTDNTPGAAA